MSDESMLGGSVEAAAPVVEESVNTEASAIETPDTIASVSEPSELPDFSTLISEDYKGLVESKGFNSVDDVMKSYSNLEKMIGNSVRIPSEDATDEAKQDFLNKIKDVDGVLLKGDEHLLDKIGKPADSDSYNFEDIVNSELLETGDMANRLEAFKKEAFEAGLTNEQASKLLAMSAESIEKQLEADHSRQVASEAALKKSWGEDYNNRLEAAKTTLQLKAESFPEAAQELLNSPLANNPLIISALSELGESFKEKGHKGMSGTEFGMTAEGAKAKIVEKRADRDFMQAYTDPVHMDHNQAVLEMQRLYKLAN